MPRSAADKPAPETTTRRLPAGEARRRATVARPVLIRRLGRWAALVDDATQLVLLQLFKGPEETPSDAYIKTTAAHVAHDLVRREARVSACQLEEALEVADETLMPDRRLSVAFVQARVDELQSWLTQRQRRIFRMMLEGADVDAIMRMEGVGRATVYNALKKIIELARDSDDDPNPPRGGARAARSTRADRGTALTVAGAKLSTARKRGLVGMLLTLPAFGQLVAHITRAGPQFGFLHLNPNESLKALRRPNNAKDNRKISDDINVDIDNGGRGCLQNARWLESRACARIEAAFTCARFPLVSYFSTLPAFAEVLSLIESEGKASGDRSVCRSNWPTLHSGTASQHDRIPRTRRSEIPFNPTWH
jgi:DNA-directed RNA polymerase specialized sigma24 family protein